MVGAGYPAHGKPGHEARAQREAHWRELIQEWQRSDVAAPEFCRGKSINPGTFSWWRCEIRRRDRAEQRGKATKRHARASTQPMFVPVRVVSDPSTAPKPFEVLVGGQIIRVLPGFDEETFRRLVAILEGQSIC